MKIAVGSDHAGFIYQEKIKQFLSALGHEVTDFGTDSEEPVDLSSLHSASRRSRSAWRRRVRRGSGRLWKRRSDGRQPRQKHPLRSLLECRIGKDWRGNTMKYDLTWPADAV